MSYISKIFCSFFILSLHTTGPNKFFCSRQSLELIIIAPPRLPKIIMFCAIVFFDSCLRDLSEVSFASLRSSPYSWLLFGTNEPTKKRRMDSTRIKQTLIVFIDLLVVGLFLGPNEPKKGKV